MKREVLASVLLGLAGAAYGHEDHHDRVLPAWWPEMIQPSVHVNAAVGSSSADDVAELAAGHHDPTREDGTVQGIELGASLLATDWLQGFATYNLYYGAEEDWGSGWEEAFLKLYVPGGFSLRGGRMLARFGAQNATHLHGWDFVDMPLALGASLGDDGLIIDGGDVTWLHTGRQFSFGATAGGGEAMTHSHDHGEDDDHDHDAEEHLEEEHAEDHDHDHAHGGWADDVYYGRLFSVYQPNDFHQWTLGVSGARGDNESKQDRDVYGVDLTYVWREQGAAHGGKSLRWVTELFVGDEALMAHEEDHEEEHAEGHDHDHEDEGEEHHEDEYTAADWVGGYTQVIVGWNAQWETGLRLGYVDGDDRDSRFRVSPAVTWRPLDLASLRLQYNYDDLKSTEEHTVWLQAGFSWAGAEVR